MTSRTTISEIAEPHQRSIITHGMVEAAAKAMIANMFAPHELPVSDDLWDRYYETARLALVAALEVQPHSEGKS